VQFEGISAVPVSDLRFKSLGQVDNLNGFKWTLLDAHAAANTQVFRNKANRRSRLHFYANLTRFVQGARLNTLALALFGLALIWIDNRDTNLFI